MPCSVPRWWGMFVGRVRSMGLCLRYLDGHVPIALVLGSVGGVERAARGTQVEHQP